MASSLDLVINQINAELKTTATIQVQHSVNSVVSGKTVSNRTVASASGGILDRAMGSIFNMATIAVNQSISKALRSASKNSGLNVIVSNYATQTLKMVITGQHAPGMTYRMANSISNNITLELLNRLPKSMTKDLTFSFLGSTIYTGIQQQVSSAIVQTIHAIVDATLSGSITSTATSTKIPGLTAIPSQAAASSDVDLASYASTMPNMSSGIVNSLASMMGSGGSGLSNLMSSISSSADFTANVKSINIPDGVDLDRFSSGGEGLGKLVEMSSVDIGSISKVPGMDRESYDELQTQLATSNVNNPLATQGGTFDNMSSTIMGDETTSGKRSITKDLAPHFDELNNAYSVKSSQETAAINKCESNTHEMGKVVAADAKTQAGSFNTLSVDQIEKLINVKEGFKDPNAKYPLPDYKDASETNLLATGDDTSTIVAEKNATRMTGAQLPNGQSWSQPASPYNAKYPYNHVNETESGHITEMDDTPGAERIHQYHKSGTFYEIDAVGNQVTVVKGSDYTIIDKNGYISIQGRANISVTGSCNVYVGADANIEASGNVYVNGHNNIEVNAAGRLKLTGGEGVDICSPEVFIDATNQLQINADVNMKIHAKELNMVIDSDLKIDAHNDMRVSADNNFEITAENDLNLNAKAKTNIHSTGVMNLQTDDALNLFATAAINQQTDDAFNIVATSDINQQSQGSMNVKAEGGIYNSTSGTFNVKSSGIAAIDGSNIWLNSGKSTDAGEAATAGKADIAAPANALECEYSDTHYKTGRKNAAENIIVESSVKESAGGKVSSLVRTAVASQSAMSDSVKATLIADIGASSTAVSRSPIIVKEAPKAPAATSVVIPTAIPMGEAGIPGNFKLSPYFTIDDLTMQTGHPYPIASNVSLMTLSRLVANLQYMAVNILEPIYAVRRDVIIDTCFVPSIDSSYDRNTFGLSVTLDFKDASSFEEYFNIANLIQNIVPFDDIIVHYMSKDFVNSHVDTALITINVSGVYYPTANQIADATKLNDWVSNNNKMNLKTWYNSTFVGNTLSLVS